MRLTLTFLLLTAALLSYLLIPTSNSVIDAYSYAAQVKYGIDLFHPHHLLHNPLNFFLLEIFSFLNIPIDPLWFGKFLNSLFALASCYMLYRIISLMNQTRVVSLLWALIVCFSFNTWRFGTENEVYIEPVFFSLLGRYFILKYIKSEHIKYVWLSAIFSATACLFHQIHIFWWLGLGVGFFFYTNRLKNAFIYFSIAAIIPLTYFAVIYFVLHQEITIDNTFQFVLRDYYKGSADHTLGLNAFVMIPISIIRSFIQVHPIIVSLIKTSWLFILPFIFIALLLVYAIKIKTFSLKRISPQYSGFHLTHLIILILQLLFAFYAKGNVEFMVMIPFLAVILIADRLKFTPAFLTSAVVILFIWNFSFGIFPNNYYKMRDDTKFVHYMKENPQKVYILRNYVTRSRYFYLTGKDNNDNIIPIEKLDIQELDSILQQKNIITDAIDYPEILNREKIMHNIDDDIFQYYPKSLILKYPGIYGETAVYEVRKMN